MIDPVRRNKKGRVILKRPETTDVYIPLRVLDERYLMQDFSYVVDINFKELQKAMNAQDYILRVFDNIASSLEFDETLTDANFQSELVDDFLSNIANLINEDENNVASQKMKIQRLQEQMDSVLQDNLLRNQEILLQNAEIENINQTIDEKDLEIEELKNTINDLTDQMVNGNNE
jgi:uncharacterized coiled-coil protein SlyX